MTLGIDPLHLCPHLRTVGRGTRIGDLAITDQY